MAPMGRVFIVGAGGHAKVVAATAQAAGFVIAGVVDDDEGRRGETLLGIPISSPCAEVLSDASALAVLAIGDNRARARLASMSRCQFTGIVHPSAVVHSSVQVSEGAVIFAGAVIQPDSAIGAHAIVNTGACVDHDCQIGEFAHVAPGTRLAGNVNVGAGAFLGIGCSAIPGVRIGDWTTVGAGAVVIQDLPAGIIAVGVPARARRS
jgi:sugar O-acyltransferase (sialic acid O-acetyltransferase NeuD family)